MWIPEGWKCGTERVKGWKLPLQPMRSLSWKCLQHIQLIPLRVAAKGGWKVPRHSKENFTFLSDVLNCFKGKQNRREVGLLKVFFLLFCPVHIETRYLELALSQHPLLDAGQTGPIIATNTSRFCPDIFLPAADPSTYTELRLTPTCMLQHLPNQPEVASSVLPKQGTSQHSMGTSVGK